MVASRHVRFIALGAVLSGACGGNTSLPAAPSPAQTASPQPTPSPPAPSPSPAPDPTDPFQGLYTLTLDLGSGCRSLLDTATIRTYTATIAARGETGYVVTLTFAVAGAAPTPKAQSPEPRV
jgi:hypothetical protein